MEMAGNDLVFSMSGGIQELANHEIDIITGGGTVHDTATHLAAAGAIASAGGVIFGCPPVAIGGAVVALIAGAVAVCTD